MEQSFKKELSRVAKEIQDINELEAIQAVHIKLRKLKDDIIDFLVLSEKQEEHWDNSGCAR